MIARIWTSFYNNWDNIRGGIERVGSILLAVIFLILDLFGINNIFGINIIPIELGLLLIVIGFLNSSIHQDHRINVTTRRVSEEIAQSIQNLAANEAATQRLLLTLDTTARNLDTQQVTMQHSLQTLSGSVKSLTTNRYFEEDEEAYKYLLQHISRQTVKEAVFLQYSCQESGGLLTTLLLNKKAKVTVFIQHEDTAAQLGSKRQVDRITSMIRNKLSDLSRKLSDPSELKVYKYHTPASVRAVKIDDQALCVGWYTYEQVDRSNHTYFPDDQVTISGHDRPTIVAWKGTEEFAILDQMVSDMIGNYRENAEEVEL